ncbi:MAG: flagellar export chaperone FlgN [Vampirovibrionales bacterium]
MNPTSHPTPFSQAVKDLDSLLGETMLVANGIEDILRAKREAIIKNDIEQLVSLDMGLELLIQSTDRLEQSRRDLFKRQGWAHPSLTELLNDTTLLFASAAKQALVERQRCLHNQIAQIAALQVQNYRLLEASLSYTSHLVSLIAGARDDQPVTYDKPTPLLAAKPSITYQSAIPKPVPKQALKWVRQNHRWPVLWWAMPTILKPRYLVVIPPSIRRCKSVYLLPSVFSEREPVTGSTRYDSILFGYYNAHRGIMAAQSAINVINNNITSADLEGYSRQRIELGAEAAWQYLSNGGTMNPGQYGQSVRVLDVTRAHNNFIDLQYRSENNNKFYYDTLSSAMRQMESIMGEPNGRTISDTIRDFFASARS